MENKCTAVSYGTYIMIALMLLLLPFRWLVAALLAAAFHELGHYGAVLLCRGQLRNVKIGVFHSTLEVTGLTDWQELLCIIAGPLAGVLLLFFSNRIPLIALCGFVQSGYNLLPIYPLDGGRMFRCVARILHVGDRWICILEAVLFFLITFLLFAAGLRFGFAVFMGSIIVLTRILSGKIPCKRRRYWI